MTKTELDLARDVVRTASRLGVTIGTAESCTGGLVCAALTDVPGSSAVLRGGVVSYDPAVKRSVLGVSSAVCARPDLGVVSEACARQMAQGARGALDCSVAVATTGIAGPSGAEPGKPVGTVWFSVASPVRTRAVRRLLPGNRSEVRAGAVRVALQLILEELEFSNQSLPSKFV